jgi:hypothetical protein
VLETSTSPGSAFDATRAPIGTAIPRLLSHQLALAGVKTGADLEPEPAHVLYQRARTLDRTPRPIESSEKAIAHRIDFRAVELSQPAANDSVMSLEQRTPRRVPELSRTFCGADNVCEEHSRENSVWLLRRAEARQEPLGLAHRLLMHLVIDPREETAQPGQLDDLASGDSRCDVLRLGALLRLAENERWHADRQQDVAHVGVLHRAEKRKCCAGLRLRRMCPANHCSKASSSVRLGAHSRNSSAKNVRCPSLLAPTQDADATPPRSAPTGSPSFPFRGRTVRAGRARLCAPDT